MRKLTPRQAAILRHLQAGPATHSEIIRATGADSSSVHYTLDVLTTRGLVGKQAPLIGGLAPYYYAVTDAGAEVELRAAEYNPPPKQTAIPPQFALECSVPMCGAVPAPNSDRCSFHKSLALRNKRV